VLFKELKNKECYWRK